MVIRNAEKQVVDLIYKMGGLKIVNSAVLYDIDHHQIYRTE